MIEHQLSRAELSRCPAFNSPLVQRPLFGVLKSFQILRDTFWIDWRRNEEVALFGRMRGQIAQKDISSYRAGSGLSNDTTDVARPQGLSMTTAGA
ncbi:hypothetical protein MRB53_042101 [Persea americana]|nr:hypothetical protein MRB53_042101 [Persea americana]